MPCADTRVATISQNESVCLEEKEKNTVKRWSGKRLHQYNLEIENRFDKVALLATKVLLKGG